MNTLYTNLTSDLLDLYNETFSNLRFSEKHDDVYHGVYYFLKNQGKQIRPLLLLLSCEMFKGNIYQALNPAFAMQMYHNSTLVHDDIIDEANYRRGQPTVNKKFNRNAAIMTGNIMYIIAYEYLLNGEYNGRMPDILKIFNQTAVQIMEGQELDLEFERKEEISVEEYLLMIEKKTSVLIAACLEIGAIVADASWEDRKHIYEFGRNIGLAFQIKDDCLDAFGSTEVTGKKKGGDIIQNKKTYLLVKAWQLADVDQKSEINRILELKDPDVKVNRMLEIYEELNISSEAEKLMKNYYNKAFHHLSLIGAEPQRKEPIRNLTNQLFNREK